MVQQCELVTVSNTASDTRITCDKGLSREEWQRQVAALGIDMQRARFFDFIDNHDGTETVIIEVDK